MGQRRRGCTESASRGRLPSEVFAQGLQAPPSMALNVVTVSWASEEQTWASQRTGVPFGALVHLEELHTVPLCLGMGQGPQPSSPQGTHTYSHPTPLLPSCDTLVTVQAGAAARERSCPCATNPISPVMAIAGLMAGMWGGGGEESRSPTHSPQLHHEAHPSLV